MGTDTRYPYTYACDFIRNVVGYGENGMKLSRSEAAQIRVAIAKALGIDDELVACRLADQFKALEADPSRKSPPGFEAFIHSCGVSL